jgi:tetratricopeptide (TPR) repeat protein
MLRALFIRLIGFILITSILAQLCAFPARADSAEDVDALNRQAVQLHNQGKYAEAFEVARQALTLAETALGPEHPDTLRSVNNLAALYDTQGRYAEAEPLYQRVLAARETVLGREHPETLTSVNNLGFLIDSVSERVHGFQNTFRPAAGKFAVQIGRLHRAAECGDIGFVDLQPLALEEGYQLFFFGKLRSPTTCRQRQRRPQ